MILLSVCDNETSARGVSHSSPPDSAAEHCPVVPSIISSNVNGEVGLGDSNNHNRFSIDPLMRLSDATEDVAEVIPDEVDEPEMNGESGEVSDEEAEETEMSEKMVSLRMLTDGVGTWSCDISAEK